MNNFNVNVGLNFRVTSASIQPAILALQKQLQSKPIHIPVTIDLKHFNTNTITSQVKNINTLNASLGKTTAQSRQAAAGMASVGKAAKLSAAQVATFAENVAVTTKRFSAFMTGASVLYFFTSNTYAAIKAALQFDREMVRLRQVSDGVGKGIADVSKEISRLSITWGASSADLAKTAVTLRQAGLSARDTKTALEALAKTTLSASFDDLNSTTEGSIALMSQFGIKARDLERELGSLSKVSADYAVESRDLVEAIKRVGGAFATTGGNTKELYALFTTIRATTRESAETIATGMRTILSRLTDPTIQRKIKNLLNIDLTNQQGQFIGFAKSIDLLAQAVERFPKGDQKIAEVIKEIGASRNLSRVIPLLTGRNMTAQVMRSAEGGADKLTKDAEIAQQSLLVQIDKLKEGFLDLFRVIANDQGIRIVFKGITDLVTGLTMALRTLQPLVPILSAVVAYKSLGYIWKNIPAIKSGFTTGRYGAVQKMSRGDVVPLDPTSTYHSGTDSVPALLTPGEFIFDKGSAQRLGYNNLRKLQRQGTRYDLEYLHRAGGLQKDYVRRMMSLPVDPKAYPVGNRETYGRQMTKMHKGLLKTILMEGRLKKLGVEPSTSKLNNYYSIVKRLKGYAHGGVVGKDLNIDILDDFLKKAGFNIDLNKYIKEIKYDENLKSTGLFSGSKDGPGIISVGKKAKISTLLHELGHSIDWETGKAMGGHEFASQELTDFSTIGNHYTKLPFEHMSIYGNGGLKSYQKNQHQVEGYANSFAAYALQKGLTQEEMKKHFPILQSHLNKPGIKNLLSDVSTQLTDLGMIQPTPVAKKPRKVSTKHGYRVGDLGKNITGSIPIGGTNIIPPSGMGYAMGSGGIGTGPPAPPGTIPPSDPNEPIPLTYNMRKRPITIPQGHAEPYPIGNTTSGTYYKQRNFLDPDDEFTGRSVGNGFPSSANTIPSSRGKTGYGVEKRVPNRPLSTFYTDSNFLPGMAPYVKQAKNVPTSQTDLFSYGESLKKEAESHFGGGMMNIPTVKNKVGKLNRSLSDRFFPTLQGLFTTVEKGVDGAEKRVSRFRGKGKLIGGAVGAAALMALPVVAESMMGTPAKPGKYGVGGAKVGSALTAGIEGASFGAMTGGMIGGPYGAAIGGFIGGITSAIGALKNFDEELARVNMEKFEKEISKVQFNDQGMFKTKGDEFLYQSGLNSLLPGVREKIEEKQKIQNVKPNEGNFFTRAIRGMYTARSLESTAKTRYTPEALLHNLAPEEAKEAIAAQAFQRFTAYAQKNPHMSRDQIIKNMGTQDIGGVQLNITQQMRLGKGVIDQAKNFLEQLRKSTELQEQLAGIQKEAIESYEHIANQSEEFNRRLERGGKNFDIRSNYSGLTSAPLQGNISAVASNLNMGHLGFSNMHKLAVAGGGYDQAKNIMNELIGKYGNSVTGEGGNENNQVQAANKIKEEFLRNYQGPMAEEMSHSLTNVLAHTTNLGEVVKRGGATHLTEQALQQSGADLIKQDYEKGNQQLNEKEQARQSRYIEQLNRAYAVRQEQAATIGERNEMRLGASARETALNPENSVARRQIGLRIGMFGKTAVPVYSSRTVSSQEREAFRNLQITQQGIANERQARVGMAGSPEEVKAAIASEQNKITNLVAQKQKAEAGGAKVEVIQGFNNAILQAQSRVKDLTDDMKNMSKDMREVEAAQQIYVNAAKRRADDLEGRKGVANVLAFGSQKERAELFQKEQITTQALQLHPEQFSQLPDEIRKMVFEQLQSTAGISRGRETYDKYGRYTGMHYETGQEAIDRLRQPYLQNLLGSNQSRMMRQNEYQAGLDVDQAKKKRLAFQGASQEIENKDVIKQTTENQANFQQYIKDIQSSINEQMQAMDKFLSNSAQLTKALNSFPAAIKVERQGKIEVVLNGGAALMRLDTEQAAMQDVIKALEQKVMELKKAPAR